MTALDFIVRIRQQDHPWQHIPVIVMTALDDTSRKYELVRSGANDYIAKPIDPLELSARAENLLRYKHLLDRVGEQKQEMHNLAMHDQLTGLYNRHFVEEQVQMGFSQAKRHQIAYSIIVLDLDFLKAINDTYGHDQGDKILVAVSHFLRDNARSNDVVARIGGEEFLLLLNHCDLHNAVNKANTLCNMLEQLKPQELQVTASFGIAQLDQTVDIFNKLFKTADMAVYRAKNRGRNCVEHIQPLNAQSPDKGIHITKM